MTARDFLKQALQVKCKLDCRIERILELKDLAVRITPILKGVPTVSSQCQSKLEKAVVDLQEQSENLGDEVLAYLATRAKIADSISLIADENEQLVLEYRYLTFKKWRQIAVAMNVSLQRVYQLHEQAVQSFEKIFLEDKKIE